MLTTTVKLLGAAVYDSKIVLNTSTVKIDIILERESQEHLSDPTRAHGLLDHGKDRNVQVNRSGLIMGITSKT